jgi:hypothetical protein
MLLNLIFTLYSNGLKTELCDNVVTGRSGEPVPDDDRSVIVALTSTSEKRSLV